MASASHSHDHQNAPISGGGMFSFHSRIDDGPGSIDPAIFAPIAKNNRERFVANLKSIGGVKEGVFLLKGGEVQYRYNTDVELAFRQESNFL